MDYFGTVDYLVLILYFLVLVGFGLVLNKRASGSLEDYFLGGRTLPWYMLGFSGMASWVNITGSMVIIAFLYMLGPRGLYIELRGGVGLILVFMLIWTGKWHRRSRCLTTGEWMIFRFGTGAGAQCSRMLAVVAVLFWAIGINGLTIKGLGIFLSMFFPFSPAVCSLGFIVIVTFYTMLSGFYGVVFTDMFQSILIFIGAIGISILALNRLGDPGAFSEIARQVTGNPDWTSSIPSWKTPLQPGFEAYEFLLMFAMFYLFQNILIGLGSGGSQVFYGARNDRECGLLSMIWTVVMTARWFIMMAVVVFGIYLVSDLFPDQSSLALATQAIKAHMGAIPETRWSDVLADIVNNRAAYPALTGELASILGESWADKLQMLSFHGGINPETILPAVLLTSIPVGFRAVIFISLTAAAMSTFDSNVNYATSFFTRDVYQNLIRPKAGNRELIFASYAFILILVAVSYAFAFSLKSVNDIWGWIVMGLNAGLVVPGILRLYWWRFNGAGYAIGTGCGLTFATIQRIVAPGLDERLQFIVIFTASLICTIIATLMTKPTPREVLETFYRRTMPFGFWGPFKKALPPSLREKMSREHKYDIIATPFVMGWHLSLLMMVMQFMIKAYTSLAVTAVIHLTCAGGMYLFWYRKLPETNYYETE